MAVDVGFATFVPGNYSNGCAVLGVIVVVAGHALGGRDRFARSDRSPDAARRTRVLSGERLDANVVRTMKSYTRCALGIGILLLGIGWIRSIQHAEHRSRAIQHGRPATAVIDERRFSSPCSHFTCDQTIYTIRYVGAGRIWRSEVSVDGWEHSHPPGSRLSVVYDPARPGRVEVEGRAPSAVAPTIGAWMCIVFGTLLTLSWGHVIRRDIQNRRAGVADLDSFSGR